MLNKTNFIKEIEQTESNKIALSQIKERFEQKPFFIEYKSLNNLLKYAKYLFAFISVLCALYFVGSVLSQAIGITALALPLAIALLLLIEIGKVKVLPLLLRKYYAYGSLSYGLILINALLLALSVYLSVKGIEQYNTKELAIAPQTTNIDSLRAYYQDAGTAIAKDYDKQIEVVRNDRKSFEATVRYRGKINMYHKPTAKKLESFETQKEALINQKAIALQDVNSDKKEALKSHSDSNDSKLSNANNETNLNTWYLICFASFNEIASLFCLWFVIFYEYRSLKEIDLINKQSENITIAHKDINTLFQYFKSGLMVQSLPNFAPIAHTPSQEISQEQAPQIGFSLGINTKSQEQRLNSPQSLQSGINTDLLSLKDREFLEAYETVIVDIKAGKKQSEILSQRYKVKDIKTGSGNVKMISKSTLQNIKRVLRNL
jgi:hypothetical protein